MSPRTAPDPATPSALDAHVVVRRAEFVLDAGLTVPAGSTTALLGPNGAGKSTVVAALAGLVPLDAGHVRLGADLLADASGTHVPPHERRVAVVFQDARLFDHLDVLDNVAFGPRSRGADRATARAIARGWIDRVDIADLAARRPASLSGGEAQRVALCRALADEPRMLLLDEPMAALDVGSRQALRRTLADHLATLDGPRLLVTHDPLEAFLLADRVVLLEDGRVTQTGTPAEVRARPATAWAAELVGTNLLRGTAHDGAVTVDGHTLRIADHASSGPVVVTVHPHAIALSTTRPEGSPRNTWAARVARVEHLGDRVRVTVDRPLPLTAEVTPEAVSELAVATGRDVWLSIKATEITATPDG